MRRAPGAMHLARVVRKYETKDGPRESVSHLIRRSFRDGKAIRHETLANVSALPEPALAALGAALAGKAVVVAGEGLEVTRSLPHGHVAAVATQARLLGLPDLLGPPCRQRDLAFALIISRVVAPASKLATTRWWADTTLGDDLGVAGASTDEVYGAMDWLVARQTEIERQLAARYLGVGAAGAKGTAGATSPAKTPAVAGATRPAMALFDLSSSWMEGSHCPLAARGYSRDSKKGKLQIEYGLLTDPDGRPVAIRVFPGNTADPKAFTEIVQKVVGDFRLDNLVMVGDRGMITSARITALKALANPGLSDPTSPGQDAGDAGTQDRSAPTPATLGWLTSLRAPAIAKLAADDGPIQPSLFDQTNLVEFSHPDYPGERLVACRNPLLAAERARKRTALLEATENALVPITEAVGAGRLVGASKIALRVGRVLTKYKMAKHFDLQITDSSVSATRKDASIAAEAALDGIYVIRTSVEERQLDAPSVVGVYKSLARVERAFRSIKIDDLDLRPVRHYLEERVKAHVFIAMLAYYLVFHLRQAWAPLTFTDEDPPERTDPVAPATRSPQATTKASTKTTTDGEPARSFRDLLQHLATLTRNRMRTGTGNAEFELVAVPTPAQRRAFELLDTTVPTRCL